jgi:hypothetical protein
MWKSWVEINLRHPPPVNFDWLRWFSWNSCLLGIFFVKNLYTEFHENLVVYLLVLGHGCTGVVSTWGVLLVPSSTVWQVMQQRGFYSRISWRLCAIFGDGNKQECPISKWRYFTALSLDYVALQYTLSNLKILLLSDVRTTLFGR